MKKMRLLFLALCIFTFTNSYSQSSYEKVTQFKKEFLTQELNLTDKEQQDFFPIYFEYSGKLRTIRKSLNKEIEMTSGAKSSNASVDKIIDGEQAVVNLQKEYYDRFKNVLPNDKIVKLVAAEKKFNAMLINKLKSEE